ncbi:MAG: class I SAM-dependent methyltransferase [Pseudomonadota bacterium]
MKDVAQAQFNTREQCITCGASEFNELAAGRFTEDPLHSFLSDDPFGEDPLPHLRNAEWRFVECRNCGQKLHQHVLNEEWNNIYYSRWISSEAIAQHAQVIGESGFESRFSQGSHAVERILQLERLTRGLRGSDPLRVLDFGCGEGHFLAAAAAFRCECVGVEFSAAREKTKVIDFFGNLDQVEEEYGLSHFHAVTLFQVLEHLSEPLSVLKELRKHIVDGGVLILETPNCVGVSGIQDKVDYRKIHPLGHINGFEPKTMELIAVNAGFEKVKTSTVQCTADPMRAYKREARRLLSPFLADGTEQFFIAK